MVGNEAREVTGARCVGFWRRGEKECGKNQGRWTSLVVQWESTCRCRGHGFDP